MKNDLGLFVEWLRDCATKLALENRADLRPVHGQLRIIKALAWQILALKAAQT